jgi:hypothetical protein
VCVCVRVSWSDNGLKGVTASILIKRDFENIFKPVYIRRYIYHSVNWSNWLGVKMEN